MTHRSILSYSAAQIAASQGYQLTLADFGAPAELVYTPRQHVAHHAMQSPFGTSEDERQPIAPANGLGGLNRGQAALVVKAAQANGDAHMQAQMAKERNQRGHGIFG